MANEVRGILFETITDAALRKAVKLSGFTGEVRWNEKPKGASVTPDFTIGKSLDEPSHVVLVTASGSSKESEKKSWRNLGEMQEVKAQMPGPPIVVNLYFKSELKQGVSAAAERLYDAILHIDKKSYHKPLESWVNGNLRNAAKTKEARREFLQESIKVDPILASAVANLAEDLSTALTQRKTDLESLWKLMQAEYVKPHAYPTARTTTVRRGLGKLSVLELHVRQLVYDYHTKLSSIPISKMPQYVFDLGFFNRTVGGARLIDPEIREVINLLGSRTCEEIFRRAPQSLHIWINPLRDLGRVDVHVDFVHKHYDDFVNPRRYKKLLIDCFNDPAGLSGEPGDEKVWVYETVVSLLKAKSDMRQGYGVAQLAVDTSTPEFGAGGFVLPPFVQRTKMLTTVQLDGLASGLSKRFAQDVAKNDIPKLKANVFGLVIKENLEDRLIPYRNFEALLWLLEAELERQGKAYTSKFPYGGWLNEYAEVGRASATTPFVRVGKTLIHWKSVSDAGKDHKRKELSARARNVKYQFHPKTKTFTHRADVEQLALIVDGTFTDADLKVLAESGWDIIVYPDQIKELVSRL
jgi:hypothetical protein